MKLAEAKSIVLAKFPGAKCVRRQILSMKAYGFVIEGVKAPLMPSVRSESGAWIDAAKSILNHEIKK